jgi:chromate transport protein ChrA
MAVVTWQLGRASITSVPTVTLALAAGVALATRRVNAVWLILAGGIVGVALGV